MVKTYTAQPFLGDNFLLENDIAAELYHDYAASMPIIDYHNHLPPADIAQNRQFPTITSIWLAGDHYKWRAMRTNGVSEHFITGEASDWEKFEAWAKTVPSTMRNPLFHWTHLELQRYFGIDTVLDNRSARDIYDHANALLQQPNMTTQGIMKKMNVEVACTTDDPLDSLEYHQQYHNQAKKTTKMLPAFRPDRFVLIGRDDYAKHIEALSAVSGVSISNYTDLLDALSKRLDFFETLGCKLSDHGFERLYAEDYTEEAVNQIFKKRLIGAAITTHEAEVFQSALMVELCKEYHRRGWTQQFHLGALRNNNSRMMRILGPDTGFDSIGDFQQAAPLSRFLDRLDSNDQLAQTIIYNLNPADNEVFASMIGNFNDGSTPGKIQWGSGWWFLDQKDGMEKQINALSNMGLLARFVGMLTDSRSFVSFPRHEYFRRILCNMIGRDVQNGELPADMPLLGQMVQDICYNNAKRYFKFG